MIAMISARAVEMPIDQIINVVGMRHGFVPARRAMLMTRLVTIALVLGRAFARMRRFAQLMLINMIPVLMMQMIIVQIIHVIAMLNRLVSAIVAMLVIVLFVYVAAHSILPE